MSLVLYIIANEYFFNPSNVGYTEMFVARIEISDEDETEIGATTGAANTEIGANSSSDAGANITGRLGYDKFLDLYKTIEEIVRQRCAPPIVSFKVGKCGSKKINVTVSRYRSETTIIFAAFTELTEEELVALNNIDVLRRYKSIASVEVIEGGKLELSPKVEPEVEKTAIVLTGLTRKTDYFLYLFGSHSISLTGRPNRTTVDEMLTSMQRVTTSARIEVNLCRVFIIVIKIEMTSFYVFDDRSCWILNGRG